MKAKASATKDNAPCLADRVAKLTAKAPLAMTSYKRRRDDEINIRMAEHHAQKRAEAKAKAESKTKAKRLHQNI